MLELRRLRYFVAVAEHGSVTTAARQLHLAQPSLSRQLQQLEAELGLTLFVRERARLRLSAAGQEFLAVARDLLSRADAAVSAAEALAAGRLDRISIVVTPTTATDVLAPFLAELEPDDPFPSVIEAAPEVIFQSLDSGADLAIGTAPPPARFSRRPIGVFPIWLYVRADDELAGGTEISVAELSDRPLLLPPRSHKPRQLLESAADNLGLTLARTRETSSAELAQALAASGRGYAVVSDDARFGLHGLRIVGPSGLLALRLYAAWDPTHHAAATIERFAGRISAHSVARYGPSAAP